MSDDAVTVVILSEEKHEARRNHDLQIWGEHFDYTIGGERHCLNPTVLVKTVRSDGDRDDFTTMGKALDEIYRLRTAMAIETIFLAGHLNYSTLPKSRRQVIEGQLSRLRAASQGDRTSHQEFDSRQQREARDAAGMNQCLTRHMFDQEGHN